MVANIYFAQKIIQLKSKVTNKFYYLIGNDESLILFIFQFNIQFQCSIQELILKIKSYCVISNKKLASVWNKIKKTFELKERIASNAQLNDGTAQPFLVTFFKDVYKAYIQSDRNSWDYQASCHNFNGLDKDKVKNDLIKQYNNCLYSIDKINPWVIDKRDKHFIKIIRTRALENEEKLSVYIDQLLNNNNGPDKKSLPSAQLKKRKKYLHEIATLACFKYDENKKIFEHLEYQDAIARFEKLLNEEYKIVQLKIEEVKKLQKKIAKNNSRTIDYSNTRWEKIADFLNRNPLFSFINAIWDAITSHATLLRWLSFALILFSFPLTFPNIPLALVITASIVGYLSFRFISFSKTNKISTFANSLEAVEKDKILDHIKQAVFNKEQYEKQISILQSQFPNLDIKYENLSSIINKPDAVLKTQLEDSLIYKKLNQVSPKTQFIASLVTKIMSVALSAYLISWAISICFNFIGALAIASLISSPLAVGLLILIPVCIFFINHLIKYQTRKNTYQRTLRTLLQEPCKFSFMNKKGALQKITLEKWEKFEHLSKEIQFLELEINSLRENNPSPQESQTLFSSFSDYLKNNDIYKSNYQDKTQCPNISSSTKIGKILGHLFSFSAGGLYGFNLGEQIAFESRLGFKSFFEVISFPMYILLFLPLIIIHATANFLTYHFNSRQRDLLFFAEHLDSKIQILEYRREILSHLTAILKELDPHTINTADTEKHPRIFIEKKLACPDLAAKKSIQRHTASSTTFFMSPTRSFALLLVEEQYSDLSEKNRTDACLNLTR